jgi:hypothetical protein
VAVRAVPPTSLALAPRTPRPVTGLDGLPNRPEHYEQEPHERNGEENHRPRVAARLRSPCVSEFTSGIIVGMDFARRAARNEELVRDVNRQIEEGAQLHEVASAMPFHCECAQASCLEKIELDARIYKPILAERYRFVVVPDHVQLGIERVVDEHDSFVVVEKIGEARDQIDRDHPQELHGGPVDSSYG